MSASPHPRPILGGLSLATRALYLALTVQCAAALVVVIGVNFLN